MPAATSRIRTPTRSGSSSACSSECLEQGIVTEAMLRDEMAKNHVRHDALELVARTPPLGPTPFSPAGQAA